MCVHDSVTMCVCVSACVFVCVCHAYQYSTVKHSNTNKQACTHSISSLEAHVGSLRGGDITKPSQKGYEGVASLILIAGWKVATLRRTLGILGRFLQGLFPLTLQLHLVAMVIPTGGARQSEEEEDGF